jgi:hypothetical protein
MDALIPTTPTEHLQGPSTQLPKKTSSPTKTSPTKNMSSAPQSRTSQLLGAGSAANADELADGAKVPAVALEASGGGWDAYDVWRRFIKEARDRRKATREAN